MRPDRAASATMVRGGEYSPAAVVVITVTGLATGPGAAGAALGSRLPVVRKRPPE